MISLIENLNRPFAWEHSKFKWDIGLMSQTISVGHDFQCFNFETWPFWKHYGKFDRNSLSFRWICSGPRESRGRTFVTCLEWGVQYSINPERMNRSWDSYVWILGGRNWWTGMWTIDPGSWVVYTYDPWWPGAFHERLLFQLCHCGRNGIACSKLP